MSKLKLNPTIKLTTKFSPEDFKPLKPFLSILLIISSLFLIVFAKMEERRVGYSLIKLTREQKVAVEEKREKTLKLAKLTRAEHVEKVALDKFTLRKVQNSQIIHLSGGSVVGASR